MTFKVLKPFWKRSEDKNYIVGDTIELSKEEAEAMVLGGYLEEVKETKPKKDK